MLTPVPIGEPPPNVALASAWWSEIGAGAAGATNGADNTGAGLKTGAGMGAATPGPEAATEPTALPS
jgi:hypothetical protein